jgi:hypothetical protein
LCDFRERRDRVGSWREDGMGMMASAWIRGSFLFLSRIRETVSVDEGAACINGVN